MLREGRSAAGAPLGRAVSLDEPAAPAAARDAGKYRLEGKEYVVKDGDVLLFKFNV